LISFSIGREFLITPKWRRSSKIVRVTTIAVNILAMIPIVKVTPKPLIAPVPIEISITAAKRVVILESIIAVNALE
jgi:hypothetical protein